MTIQKKNLIVPSINPSLNGEILYSIIKYGINNQIANRIAENNIAK
jgi:hypothetical protein